MRYLYQEKGVRGSQLLQAFPNYSKATIYRHVRLPIDNDDRHDKRKHNKGRPRKLSIREERILVRELRKLRTTIGYFCASRLRTAAGISPEVSLWTIRRALKRHGYSYLHSRKKGLLTQRAFAVDIDLLAISKEDCRVTSGNAASASTSMRRLSFIKLTLLIRPELRKQWHGEGEVKVWP